MNFDGRKVIKQIMIERNTDIAHLAAQLGIQEQSMRNKISRNSFTLKEFAKLVALLDCHLQVVTNDTGKIFD